MPSAIASPSLADLGWDDGWAAAMAALAARAALAATEAARAATEDPAGGQAMTPGRVSRIDRGACTVLTAAGPCRVATDLDLPVAVGDWVTLDDGSLTGVLPRRCTFRRVTEHAGGTEQVAAANIDTVLLVDAVDGHLSLRHLERYLALAWQSGAVPVVVITKLDLAPPSRVLERVTEVQAVALGVAVLAVSAATGEGMDGLAPYLSRGRTVALLGLSGAGKSTLVNRLAGTDVLTTGKVRSDGQGRHTTSHRQLVPLPGGGLLIDTPGMRALSVLGAADGVALAFADIEALAVRCPFPDCSHTLESGCAVLAALADGRLDGARLESWRRLRGQPGQPNHQAARDEVVDRKRQKAVAKAARARTRSE